jgi:hypothetical protein
MDHPTVVPRLMRRQPPLALEHHQRQPRPILAQQRHRGRHPHDAAADDRHVELPHRSGAGHVSQAQVVISVRFSQKTAKT